MVALVLVLIILVAVGMVLLSMVLSYSKQVRQQNKQLDNWQDSYRQVFNDYRMLKDFLYDRGYLVYHDDVRDLHIKKKATLRLVGDGNVIQLPVGRSK